MLPQVVQDAINDQIREEFMASYNYLAMAAYCHHQNFHGFAQWLKIQSDEEHSHAKKLFDFMVARGCKVDLKEVAQPPAEFSSILNVFEEALEQEKHVSQRIDALYELAFQEKAFAALVELQWFITEQVEEEQTFRDVVAKIKLVQDDPSAMLDLDREMGSRTDAPEAEQA